MEDAIINPTPLNIYGLNEFINKFKESSLEIIDLDLLKEEFQIDSKLNDTEEEIVTNDLPAFTQLTFNKRIKETDISYSESYNRPPIGPLENFTYCSFCNNVSPQFHTEECQFPEKKSLYLTIQGIFYYIIKNTKDNFGDKINKLKELWLSDNLSQEELNKFLLIPNSVKVKIEKIKDIVLDDTLTNIQYLDIVKTRGPSKQAYKTVTEKFSNAVMISYEYVSGGTEVPEGPEGPEGPTKKSSIRIYKNGLINIINRPSNPDTLDMFNKTLIDRINETEAVDIDNFNKMARDYLSSTDEDFDEYSIIQKISYVHSVNSQFNMWPNKSKYIINFNKFNDLITPLNSGGKIVSGEFTNVIDIGKKQIMELISGDNKIKIFNWEYIGEDQIRTDSTNIVKRKIIKCIIIPKDGIKISLQIFSHGTFQMSMSYCNPTDLRNSICNKVIDDKSKVPLDFKYFELVKQIFKDIFMQKPNLYGQSLEYLEDTSRTMFNTVSGNAPPNKEGTSTAVCRSGATRPGFPGLRPIPYSFHGTCPEYRQYINPNGIKGNDGLYYPCCAAKTKKSEEDYKKYLINGFPKDAREASDYGVNSVEDNKSGILIPGSLNIGAITKAKIGNKWVPVKLVGYKGKSKKPKELFVQNLETKQIITINRNQLERDSRYYPGLKSLSRDNLIRCILKNLKTLDGAKDILELNNLEDIKKLITVPNPTFNPAFCSYNISKFQSINYYVTSVPNNCEMYYLYINKDESYLINIKGNKKNISFSDSFINEEMILFGFFNKKSDKYFVTDILYFNKKLTEPFSKKIEMLNQIRDTYFLTSDNIEFCEYKNNIIKGSKELLQEASDILLVFTPETNYLNVLVWNEVSVVKDIQEITLQVMRRIKTNHFMLGYDNTNLNILTNIFNDIFMKKDFIEENKIKINDYVLFKFDYNIQTGQLSTRILLPEEKSDKPNLTYNETLIKLSLIINPIKESFFMNNRIEDDYVWDVPGRDLILKHVDDALPLVKYE